jgi:voltage-gated potassium channel
LTQGSDPPLGRAAQKLEQRPLLRRTFGDVPGVRWLIAGIIAVVLVCALLARLLAGDDFPTFGIAAWWAVQTVTTVGYGDIVPHDTAGKLVAAVLMIAAIAFISIFTAAISAGFVRRVQSQQGASEHQELLRGIDELNRRLQALEQKLGGT